MSVICKSFSRAGEGLRLCFDEGRKFITKCRVPGERVARCVSLIVGSFVRRLVCPSVRVRLMRFCLHAAAWLRPSIRLYSSLSQYIRFYLRLSLHSFKTTNSNDRETLWLEGGITIHQWGGGITSQSFQSNWSTTITKCCLISFILS